MKFLRKYFEKQMDTASIKTEVVPAVTETMIAELIKDPVVVSSRMVRKIVLNGLMRLEKEGADPFGDDATK